MVARSLEQRNAVDLASNCSLGDLLEIAGATLPEDSLRQLSIERLGSRLPALASPGAAYAAEPQYWRSLKHEFHLLVCTDDKKYAALRKQLEGFGKHADKAVVAAIATAMASVVGVLASVLASFVAILLIAFLKLGKEAFCAVDTLDLKAA